MWEWPGREGEGRTEMTRALWPMLGSKEISSRTENGGRFDKNVPDSSFEGNWKPKVGHWEDGVEKSIGIGNGDWEQLL